MNFVEGQILIWTSLILAIIQSYKIQGTFEFFGYIMWLICVLIVGISTFISGEKK